MRLDQATLGARGLHRHLALVPISNRPGMNVCGHCNHASMSPCVETVRPQAKVGAPTRLEATAGDTHHLSYESSSSVVVHHARRVHGALIFFKTNPTPELPIILKK